MDEREEARSGAAVVQPTETTVSRRSVIRSGIAVATIGAGLSGSSRVSAGRRSRGPVQQGEGEPNDSRPKATRIEPGVVRGHIGPCCLPYVADEDDWLRFDVASGDELLVNFDVSPPTRARLLGPGNSVLDVEGYNPSRLSGTTQGSGTAYVHLTGPPGGANSEYAFTLEINGQSGNGGDGGDGGTGGNDGSERLLEVVAKEEGPVRYELTVDGTIRKARVNDNIKAEENDRIIECGDGKQILVGFTGNPGKGDAYLISGPVVSFEPYAYEAEFVVRLDGEEVTYEPD